MTYVITSTFLRENICHGCLPQERRRLHHQLAVLEEPLPLKLSKHWIQVLPLPQPTQQSFSFLHESFANLLSTRSAAGAWLAVPYHQHELPCWDLHNTCVLQFKNQFRKLGCSWDDVFSCQYAVTRKYFFPFI